MDIIIGLLAIVFALPLLTGYLAYKYKRSFWLWFVLAMVLPFISWFLLVILTWRDERKQLRQQKQQDIAPAIIKTN
ncbi:hypothetical protein DXT99_14520 [Pontibacter diazotrophicus]|uniref:Uncharacterized protein n=1 Tax=Pontibacter diazotrophicus TaxID=1400979 RepID=A0A3D8LAD0_9BACT|nr:hypothetical protein [Pontibacter diazotrophicus]RDV14338.1 hypothetical protein DXT99_14520 [Pontibacter diazotrophicus]